MRHLQLPRLPWVSLLLLLAMLASARGASDVVLVSGSTRKICQLTGDWDNHWNIATQNLTDTRWQLNATDLGVPFTHQGRTYVLFGDTWGGTSGDRDAIAWTTDPDPEDGLDLTFVATNGLWRPITIPGIAMGAYNVPLDGFSQSNNFYLWHTTDHTATVPMGRSVLAVSTNDGYSFRLLYTLSRTHFINVSVNRVNLADWPGFPQNSGDGLVLFGSGSYRASDVRLAFQPAASIEESNSVRFFAGLDAGSLPVWSTDETQAVALFSQPEVGELSAAYNPFLKRWLLLYNSSTPRGIILRSAPAPWGPWSDPQVLFDPWSSGYGQMLHIPSGGTIYDTVQDVGRDAEWGGEYGPYLFKTYVTGANNRSTLYYTMSTWNPYAVVLMKSEIQITNLPAFALPPSDQTVALHEPATFEAAGSAVGPLAYTWQINGITVPGATSNLFRYTPTQANESGSSIQCVLSNALGTVSSRAAILRLTSGNTAPTPEILAPAPGHLYTAGQTLSFAGAAFDAGNGGLPPAAFRWDLTWHRSNYCHAAVTALTGVTNGTYTVPLRGETDPAGWYRIHLTVTDAGGRSSHVHREVFPRVAPAWTTSSPTGMAVRINGQNYLTPRAATAVAGSKHLFEAITPGAGANTNLDFMSWSSQGPATHTLAIPAAGLTNYATFRPSLVLIPWQSTWRFWDSQTAPDDSWTDASFNDSAWPQGPGQLGFGDGDEATLVVDRKQVTAFFRHAWTVSDPSMYASLTLSLIRDDGGTVYLNGNEVFRSNLGGGWMHARMVASSAVTGANESRPYRTVLPASLLVPGLNVLAVEIHQFSTNPPANDTDLSFDLELRATRFLPPLQIQQAAGQTRLAWPEAWLQCTVEAADALSPSPAWAPVSGTESSSNGVHYLRLDTPAPGARFYRFRLP